MGARTVKRTVKVWAWIAEAAGEGAPVSIAALGRAAAARLGVDGASVTAMTGSEVHEPVFATDDVSAAMEELQFTLGEGPCVDAFGFGSPMLIPELGAVGARWPGFVAAAVAADVRALFALPLHSGAIQVGVLALYRARPGHLTPDELADVLVFADVALQLLLDGAFGLVDAGEYRPTDWMSTGRTFVYQATGMISEQLGVSVAEAFVRLRAHTFTGTASLAEVAGEVVS
ncbi:MAG: ANTAR domain-containing protein, partial [Sciscionella sp.]